MKKKSMKKTLRVISFTRELLKSQLVVIELKNGEKGKTLR